MLLHYFLQGLFVAVGTLSLLASLLDWDWFFRANNTQFIVRSYGRRVARLFYGIVGLAMIGTGVYFFLQL